jgi:ferredoxin--NADP+ reductase
VETTSASPNRDQRESTNYDLIVVGGTAGGLSLAISSQRSGLRVRIVEGGLTVAFPELVGREALDIGYDEPVHSIEIDGQRVSVRTDKGTYSARAAAVTERGPDPAWKPSIDLPDDTSHIHVDSVPIHVQDKDVLVVGQTDHVVEVAAQLAALGGRVVLAANGLDPKQLSPAGDNVLRTLERERQATVLYRSAIEALSIVDGFPVVYFTDRHTPDLEFDHVVFAGRRRMVEPSQVGVTEEAARSGQVWFLGTEPEARGQVPVGFGHDIGRRLAKACFPEVELTPEPDDIVARQRLPGVIDELRVENYNATITKFEPAHSDLWVLRICPDGGATSHVPGQYASLGLGYWEKRIDDAVDRDLDTRWFKLVRRSYSISNRIFDDHGYLAANNSDDELEFYIVLVPPGDGHVPALTPRLALKRPGDRIYLGPKVTGRYTLAAVNDPSVTVLLLSTGTGEAPHNAMAVELLRKGHYGSIISAVSVRNWTDLGYLDKHLALEQRYQNYHYLPLPTREPDVPKRYIQDLVRHDVFSRDFGLALDPASTHVYLCGNPAMIGLPETGLDGNEEYPSPEGVIELLVDRGFVLDRRGQPGNIHFEEYW